MNKIPFYKYQGTGNDFIMIDNRTGKYSSLSQEKVNFLCDRRFGIGADGLILLEKSENADFQMVYYNSDGNESTMCGNGGRCLVAFAHELGLFNRTCLFNAIDGLHQAEYHDGIIELKMIDVNQIKRFKDDYVLNTGSPHYVQYAEKVDDFPVYEKGKAIRESEEFIKEGINVNFVEILGPHHLAVRTYERGVEDETLSCGTGVSAAAISYLENHGGSEVDVEVLGGTLKVRAEKSPSGFQDVWLIGPAEKVFEGQISI